MTNGFALNHDKSLQIYFICVKYKAKYYFLKDDKILMHSNDVYLVQTNQSVLIAIWLDFYGYCVESQRSKSSSAETDD